MKLLAVIVFLVLVLLVIFLIAMAIYEVLNAHKIGSGEWEVKERTLRNGALQIQLYKPGEPLVNFGDPISSRLSPFEYNEILEEKRIAAQDRADALNRRLEA